MPQLTLTGRQTRSATAVHCVAMYSVPTAWPLHIVTPPGQCHAASAPALCAAVECGDALRRYLVCVRRGAKTWLLIFATYTAVISYRHSTENERHKGYRVIAYCTSTSTKVIAYCRRDSLFQFPESRKMIRFSHRHSGKLVKLIRRPRAAAPCSACIRRRC